MKTFLSIIEAAVIIGFIALVIYTGVHVSQVEISLFAGV